MQSTIDPVLASVEFKPGPHYSDYLPDVDNVAAWTIGGLVAGKVLAKAGLFVFLLKFWKLIALGLFGAGGVEGVEEEEGRYREWTYVEIIVLILFGYKKSSLLAF